MTPTPEMLGLMPCGSVDCGGWVCRFHGLDDDIQSAVLVALSAANSGKEKEIPATFQASTLRMIADHFDPPREGKVIMYPSRQMQEEWAILLNQIADELEGG